MVSASARADDADPVKAKVLFEEGRKLVESSDKATDPAAKASMVDTACAKFSDSVALDPQLGTKLNLADCRQRQGKLVDAYAVLVGAAADAAKTHDREAFARDQLAVVAAKLVRVTLHVAEPGLAGLSVRLSGRTLPRAEWAQEHVFVPGPIVVELAAPGRTPMRIAHDGAAGGTVVIEVPVLAQEAATDAPIVATHERSKIPYVVAGAGGAMILTSVVLGLHARSRYDTAKSAGDENAVHSAQHEADIGTVFVAAGAVAAAIGIWLYVRDTPDRATVTATLGADRAGLAIVGRF